MVPGKKNSTISVLYVDDEPCLLSLAKLYLEKNGDFKVDTLETAKDALEQLGTVSYDAIISDYLMPEIDGIGFLKKVRERFGEVPFILFTGKGREDVVIEAINNGADFFIQKGGDPKSQFVELGHKIKKAVDQRLAEKALKGSEQRLSDIINFLPDATFAIDTKGTVIAWNRAMEDMTGVGNDDIIGMGNYEYALPFYGERRPLLLDLVLKDDEKIREKYPFVLSRDNKLVSQLFIRDLYGGRGAYLWFVASPLYDTKGIITGAIESIRDITEQKQFEKERNAAHEKIAEEEEELRGNYAKLEKQQHELLKSEERYRNIVEDQTEFISRFLPDGTHVFVNEAYCRYFGTNRDDIIGHIFKPVIPKEDRKKLKEHFRSLSAGNPVAMVEHRIVMPDGSERWQRWSDRAIFDEAGAILEYQSVGRDITEIKNTELELGRSHEQLSAAYEEIAATEEELRSNYNELAKNQELLQKGEEKYHTLAENIPAIVYRVLVKEGRRMQFFNRMLEQFTGYTPEELTSGEVCSIEPLIHPEDRARVVETVGHAIRQHIPFEVEYRMIVKDGSARYFMERGRPVFGSHGDLEYVDGTINDIDERKHIVKSLAESEAKFRSIFENMQEAFYRTDLAGNLVLFSPEGVKQAGYDSADEMLGLNIAEVIYSDPSERSKFLEALRKDGSVSNYPVIVKARDDTLHHLVANSHFYYDDSGNVLGVEGILHDITAIKDAEEEIRKSETKFRILVEASTDVLWEVDLSGKFTYISPQCVNLTGYTPEELTGSSMFDLITAEHVDEIVSLFSTSVLKKTASHSLVVPVNHHEGHIVDVEIRSVVLYDDNGEIRGYGGIALDITERKRMEESLRASEEKFRLLVENSHDIIYTLSADGIFTFVSPVWTTLLGHPVDQVLGKSFTRFVHPDDIPGCMVFLQSVISTGQRQDGVEYRVQHIGGTWYWHTSSAVPFRDGCGIVTGFYGIAHDTTKRRQVEEALRERERFLTTLISNLPGFVYRCANDPTWTMEYMSDGCVEITGYAPDDFLGNKKLAYNDVIHPEFRSHIWNTWQDRLEKRETFEEEYPIITKTGELRWVWERGQGIFSDGGRLLYLEGFITDITGRKLAEEALRKSEQQYRLIADNSTDVIWTLDLNGKVTYVSPSVTLLRGYTPEEVLKQTLPELISPGSIDIVEKGIQETFAEAGSGSIPAPHVTEVEQPCKDGSSVWTEIVSRVFFDSTGKPAGMIGVSRNITDRRRAEEALRQAGRKLNLLTGITRHDISNQLTVLRGYLSILEKQRPAVTATDYLMRVETAAERISAMIRFTKEYEQIGIHAPAWQNFRKLVDNAVKDTQAGTVGIVNSFPPDEEVFADPLIVKVCYNLIDNALRYGGKISTIRFSVEENDTDHIVVCEDDGNGVPAEEKEKIFERGFGKNTGMGLFFAREILSITGITIRETGEPGGGARFEIMVPKGMWRRVAKKVP